MVRARCPHLAAVDLPAAFDLGAAGPDGSEVRARVRLAHADANERLAPADLRDDFGSKLVAAVADEQRPHLPVGCPVRAHRGTYGQQFFQHHIALQHALSAAADVGWPGHAKPPFFAHLPGEIRVAAGPVVRPLDA
ncbi:hypothetical protein D3C72_1764520 [compost metagenome]